MSKWLIICMICLFFILSGCSGTVNVPEVKTISVPQTKFPTIHVMIQSTSTLPLNTATETPASTIMPTPTNLPEPANTITPNALYQKACASIAPEKPSGFQLNGTLALMREKEDYLLDLQTNHIYILHSEGTPDADTFHSGHNTLDFSPNHKWLAFTENTSGDVIRLRLVNGQGQQKASYQWPNRKFAITGWLDDQRLTLSLPSKRDGSLTIFNPFTGQEQTLDAPFSDIQTLFPNIMWYAADSSPVAVYHPDLSQVAYLNLEDSFVLWDVSAKKAIWSKASSPASPRPAWSPDGSLLAVDINKEDRSNLFLVSRDGQETQIAQLAQYYAYTSTYLGNFVWSPDSQKIAFWVVYSQQGNNMGSSLDIIDVKTHQITDYCISGDVPSVIIWSPDSQYLALNSFISPDSDDTRVVVLDTTSRDGYEVVKGDYELGWMINP